MKLFFVTALITICVFSNLTAQEIGLKQPNILFILTDDQGYGDLGCYGSTTIATPNVDKLCSEGMKFKSFYVHNRCSPTRLAFMTGSHADRAGYSKVIYRHSKIGINKEEITVAELLKKAGYTTGIVGKWHLGEWQKFNPVNHGFDSFYGFMDYAGLKPPERKTGIWRNKKLVEEDVQKTDGIHSPKLLKAGIEFIKENKDKPFFLYYASPLPHVNWLPMDRFKGTSEQGTYGDVLQELDWQVGELLNILDELGIADNTLVIYASDNGPQLNAKGHGSAGDLRAGKWSDFEGGIRTPWLMRWPGHIPVGTTTDCIGGIWDLLPTFCAIAGVQSPTDRVIDGVNLLPVMLGATNCASAHDTVIMDGSTIRRGDWKLYLTAQKPGGQNRDGRPGAAEGSLFNLKNDLGETTDVSPDHLEIVQQLRTAADSFHKDLISNSRPIGRLDGASRPSKKKPNPE